MTDRVQFWQKYLQALSDTDLCGIKARGMRRNELHTLLEVLYERLNTDRTHPLLRRRFRAIRDLWFDKWSAFCVDCGVDVHEIGEYFMVLGAVWNTAWRGRYRSPIGDGQLCIGCLERRLGRTLMSCDFSDAPINDPRRLCPRSDRLRNRLTATVGAINGGVDGLMAWMVERMLQRLPPEKRAAAREAWNNPSPK